MSLENAVNEVVKRVKETEEIAQELDVPSDMTRYDNKLDQLIERIERSRTEAGRVEDSSDNGGQEDKKTGMAVTNFWKIDLVATQEVIVKYK